MLRTALGIVVTCLALVVAVPAAQAATGSKSSAKKTAVKKSSAKAKASAPRKPSAKHAKATTKPAKHAKRDSHAKKHVAAKEKHSYQRVAFTQPAPAAAPVAPVLTAGDMAGLHHTRDALSLKSNAAFVIDQSSAQVLFEKNSGYALPIASLTKLMTALVVVEARQNMDDVLEVTSDDIDREKNSHSRLRVGSQMTRANMLHIALMSSENRAASALGRHYPGGLPAFVAAMNAKARALGMKDAHFVDSTGLSSQNVASARDLAKLVVAASQHPVIREYSTDSRYAVDAGGYQLNYMNSNRLVMNSDWDIGLQKTGYITEAGRCLVMQARIEGRPVVMVFLDSKGKESRLADASRVRKWLEVSRPQAASHNGARQS
ncbi:D-alanyl-D-alanine endopeptidase [Noviherbaspirillum denitrificans]|uniref:D-alanyl-D-alanine carboxypeptidase n=1 Tax=Noviherbaspirillum denitrificans TaxID=1968433 RepID=A0A254T943_9BURK|nr:D-alanyl-D-alanine endopeptidase [Noviherbaspirillum denitrificans]OWW19166.1 D-alanyl-D-alanine carboxypeptidase [Noviherbaspirillum denitrificans]